MVTIGNREPEQQEKTREIMDHYNFDELNAAADISILRGIPELKQTTPGELHGACPFGGTADHTGFWINVNRKPMTWACRRSCPGCSSGGDAMQYIAMREHLNRKTDAQKIAGILAAEIGAAPSTFCNVSGTPGTTTPPISSKPRTLTAPPQQWQRIVKTIVENAARKLRDFSSAEAVEALDYLHERGITDKMIDRYKIGYIPTVQRYFGYYVDLATGDKKFRKAAAGETFIYVPEGITIPTYLSGDLYRVKVRKLNRRAADQALAKNMYEKCKAIATGNADPVKTWTEHDCRYSYISGAAGTDTALFNGDAAIDMHPLHDIVFVEGELDALLINSIMQPIECDQLQAVTFGSAGKNPPYEQYYRYFRTPARIVIAYDNDDAGREGAERLRSQIMNISTRETPPVIKHVPEGYKDFGEYYAAGGDIYKLVSSWFPLQPPIPQH